MKPHRFDALILTALLDELEPVLAFSDGGTGAWRKERDSKGFPYHVRELASETGGPPLLIAAASFNAMGASITAARATALIEELNPACLAMCGICAGNKKEVALGDVIVADRLYDYEAGKHTVSTDKDGQRHERLDHDLRTYNLEATWRVNAEYFARELDWTAELVKERPPAREAQVHWLLCKLLEYEEKREGITPQFVQSQERRARCPDWPTLWPWLKQPENGALMALSLIHI